ncbi:hypothetical protein EMIHUDRAFT_194378 [Emiliania huxleyi CCMP1516]|uniref:Carboxypeptidase n=2 Tax=Emiliania huxleyi TaxID=2903 RepID=A0A0D3L1E6_EMIH1|nr:hypothetical protein EMIHUDRAFT_194378 [Emiliania huxleyi CCMP1516]EOD41831.1 hypothetical protein EMIHUDRAFT_194378 [Emiliania huxleyi CCMP1516]|eukprot:XP_005794260.1 hypothetical protein EMIHUDRAFT_194378 [Emiliania huxleyi CCMP1516]
MLSCCLAAAALSGPNFVTPLLQSGSVADAQAASRVSLPGWSGDLYSGFFTVDAATASNTYFVFSKALSKRDDAPVLLWLNGGPGASSLLGFYEELGPFGISAAGDIEPRTVNWNMDAHLLALDNPLGTGFSFTHSLDRMATNQTVVGEDLYSALQQFFDLFPELRANEFYATGESYAGKYIPSAAYAIHSHNAKAAPPRRINLRGIAIGDGAFDPPTQLTGFGPLLFSLGLAGGGARPSLADADQAKVYEAYDRKVEKALAKGDTELNGDYFQGTFYANTTGMGGNYFNFAQPPSAGLGDPRPFVREALHVGSVPYAIFNQTVETQLLADWMVGVVPQLQALLDHYRVLIYSGQNDVILGPPGTERAVNKLQWSGSRSYAAAKTEPMYGPSVAGGAADLMGYARRAQGKSSNFTYVLLRGCGHMVPTDQPALGSLEKAQGGANAARSPLRAAGTPSNFLDVGPCGRVAC